MAEKSLKIVDMKARFLKKKMSKTKLQFDKNKTTNEPGTENLEIQPQFQPSDSSNPLDVQVEENLNRFGDFLKAATNASDLADNFDTVSQCLREFYNQTQKIKFQKEKGISDSKEAFNQFDSQLQDTIARNNQLSQNIASLKEKIPQLQEVLIDRQKTLSIYEGKLQKIAKAKLISNRIQLHLSDLQTRAIAAEKLCNEKKEKANEQIELLNSSKEQINAQIKQYQEEIANSEAKLKSLLSSMKKSKEQMKPTTRPRQMTVKEPNPTHSKSTPTRRSSFHLKDKSFVIEDTLKVSNQEVVGLQFMIDQLEKENAQLQILIDSKKDDIKCLSEENIGLKEIIREMTENPEN